MDALERNRFYNTTLNTATPGTLQHDISTYAIITRSHARNIANRRGEDTRLRQAAATILTDRLHAHANDTDNPDYAAAASEIATLIPVMEALHNGIKDRHEYIKEAAATLAHIADKLHDMTELLTATDTTETE